MIARLCVLVSTILFLNGCSKESNKLPTLVPVKGSITNNGHPVKEGFVRFMPADNQDLIVSGDVDANGKFELFTVRNSNRQKGAPHGTFTVTYSAPSADQKTPPITSTKTYTIEAGTTDLNIELIDGK